MMRSGGTEHGGASSISGESDATGVALAPRCALWGVLNVTPDSFSDGGRFLEPRAAAEHARALLRAGASVIDIGGASSRPAGGLYGAGAETLTPEQELTRVLPALEAARELGARVSIDTAHALVAERATALGARIVNDVSCAASPALLDVVARAGVEYVVMHTRGRGEVAPPNTDYRDVCAEVCAELIEGVARARAHGVMPERIWLDPGIGFAKTARQSAAMLGQLEQLCALGFRVLVGASRKGFIAELAPNPDGSRPSSSEREAGSVAVVALAVAKGAAAVRVHDVAAARQALLVTEAVIARSSAARTRAC